MKKVDLLPSLLTTCNLFCGVYAIIMGLGGKVEYAAKLIFVAMFFDFFDGLVARLKKASTKFGVEYDSLADLVSFGMAPVLIVYSNYIANTGRFGVGLVFIYIACTALRLARYNVQKVSVQRRYFVGMPAPAAAGFISAVVLFIRVNNLPQLASLLPMIIVLLSFLMVSTFKYPSISVLNLGKKKPFIYLVVFVVCGSIALFQLELFLLLFFISYFLLGFVRTKHWEEAVLLVQNKAGMLNEGVN